MSDFEFIDFSVADHVATITLNRPKVANAMNKQMSYELMQASIRCSEDSDIRAVVLTGAGKLFCGGGDLPEFAGKMNEDDIGAHLKEMTIYVHGAVSRFARMNAPLIGAINGTAGGAGFSFVCACDLVYIADTAKLTLAYTAAGLTPDGSSTYFLPRIVGLRRATELALTNRRLTAAEALDWGIVNEVVAAEDVLDRAQTMARRLANGPTLAFGFAKRLLTMSFDQSLETQMENEAQGIVAITKTSDAQAGIKAFLNKETPTFKGV